MHGGERVHERKRYRDVKDHECSLDILSLILNLITSQSFDKF